MKLFDIELLGSTTKRNVPCLNCGGCAIYTLALYRHIRKFKLLKGDEKFVYIYNQDDIEYRINNDYLNKKINRITSCSHACLYHDGMYVDSNGLVKIYEEDMYHILPAKKWEKPFLLKSINSNGWNDLFNREKYIPIIEKILQVDLSDIIF